MKADFEWVKWFEEEWNRVCQEISRYCNLDQVRLVPSKKSDLYAKLFGGESDGESQEAG